MILESRKLNKHVPYYEYQTIKIDKVADKMSQRIAERKVGLSSLLHCNLTMHTGK